MLQIITAINSKGNKIVRKTARTLRSDVFEANLIRNVTTYIAKRYYYAE